MDIKKVVKMGLFAVLIGVIVISLSACKDSNNSGNQVDIVESTVSKINYESISQESAKQLMDNEENYIILDVRTPQEYSEGHIKDAILIPDYEVSQRAENELKDKNQLILVYCRSGNRSKNASKQLANLGYTNVKEFGGINNWKYEIVK